MSDPGGFKEPEPAIIDKTSTRLTLKGNEGRKTHKVAFVSATKEKSCCADCCESRTGSPVAVARMHSLHVLFFPAEAAALADRKKVAGGRG